MNELSTSLTSQFPLCMGEHLHVSMPSAHVCHSENNQHNQQREVEMTNHKPHFFDLWTSLQHQSQDLNEKQSCNSNNQLFPVSHHHQQQRRPFCFSSSTNISLELCTESLGSETGTYAEDGINSLFHHDQQTPHNVSPVPESYHPVSPALANRRSRPFGRHERSKEGLPSFPPPLVSSSHNIHVSSHRENGRLVLRAVTRPTRNYLEAERIDGRLRLRLLCPISFPDNGYEDEEEKEEDEGEEQDEEEQGCQVLDGPKGYELVLTHHQQSRRSCVVLKSQHQAAANYVVNHHHFVLPPRPRWWNDPVTSSSAFFLPNRSRHGIPFPPTTIRSTLAEAEDDKGEEQRRRAARGRCSPEDTEPALGLTTLGGGRCIKESRQAPAFLLREPPFYVMTTS